jgi:hypothetical protein
MGADILSRTLELKAGKSRILVEVDELPERGLKKFSGEEKLEENFSKVSAALKDVVESIEAQLSKLLARPDEITLEMGAKLSGEADLWIVKGDAEASMTLTLKWTKPSKAG